LLALGFLAAVTACSSTPSGDPGTPAQTPAAGAGGAQAAQPMRVTVENNRPGGSTVTIFIVPDVGVRRQLGEVQSGQTATFTYSGAAGPYRLLAQGGGGDFTSNSFRIFENTGEVHWNMASNNVRVQNRR
jgi:hypothetical protein